MRCRGNSSFAAKNFTFHVFFAKKLKNYDQKYQISKLSIWPVGNTRALWRLSHPPPLPHEAKIRKWQILLMHTSYAESKLNLYWVSSNFSKFFQKFFFLVFLRAQ